MEELDMDAINAEDSVPVNVLQETPKKKVTAKVTKLHEEVESCLRNTRVKVRFLPKSNGVITNTKHVLYGGLAETSSISYTVPLTKKGEYHNVLTNKEKAFLELEMGLEPNALSVYKVENNYWDNFLVTLGKEDNILDLSTPAGFISYKVLLANKDNIAPSLAALQDTPKATYRFVIIEEGEEDEQANKKTNTKAQCWMEYGKHQTHQDILALVVETLDGRPLAKGTKLSFLQNRCTELIEADAKLFLATIRDEYIDAKILIRSGVESGLISFKANGYYLRKTNAPLCEDGQDPTLSNAAKYLSKPKHQDIMMLLQADKNKS